MCVLLPVLIDDVGVEEAEDGLQQWFPTFSVRHTLTAQSHDHKYPFINTKFVNLKLCQSGCYLTINHIK